MERVSSMLARAVENRRRQQARRSAEKVRPVSTMRQDGLKPRHGEYTALMRSHDRVHSRHVSGKGGAHGA